MMRNRWFMALSAVLVLGSAAVAFGALTAQQKAGAEALITQLSSKEFKDREAAVEKLVAMGPDVTELINPLLKSEDAELRMRAQMILKRIGEATPAPAPEAGAFDRVKGSSVTMKLTNVDLQSALERIAQQTGTQVPVMPEKWEGGKRVTVNFDKTPYWEAMDKLCEMEGVVYYSNWRDRKLQLMTADATKALATCYSGPVVFKIVSVGTSRTYWGPAASDQLTFQVMAFWEDLLTPAWGEPVVLDKLTDEKGVELKANVMDMSPFGMFGAARIRRGGRMTGPPLMTTFALVIQGVRPGVTRLGEVSGKLTMGFAKGTQEITIEDVMGEGKKSGKVGAYELVVSEAIRKGASAALMTTITKDGKPADRVSFGGDEQYGIWLVDQQGKKYPGEIMNEGVTMQWAGQPNPPAKAEGAEKPGPTGNHQVMFWLPDNPEIVRLVYVLPTEGTKQVYEFKFTGVGTE